MEPAQPSSTDITAILATVATLEAAHAAQEAKIAAQEAKIATLEAAQTRRRSRLPGHLLHAVLAAGLAAFLLGSSARAAIPDTTTNVFTGCYRTAGSMNLLYVLDAAQQPTCPTGMSLTTWCQSGLANYGYFYSTAPEVLPPGNDVIFIGNNSTPGITFDGSRSIRVATAGTYQVTYMVSPSTSPGAFALTVDGNEVAGTQYDSTSASPYSGQALLSLAASDVVTLRDVGGTALTTSLPPPFNGVSASLVIEKLT